MRIGSTLLIGSIALTLAGCATEDPATSPPTTNTPPPTTPSGEVPIEEMGRGAFLAALMSIDLEFMQEPERALEQVGTVCADIEAGKPEQTIIDDARQRFSSDTLALTEEQARRVVDAARANVC